MRKCIFPPLLLSLLLIGCANSTSPPADAEASPPVQVATTKHEDDPFEGFNRAMWTVNYEYLDPYIARPVSLAYVNYVPDIFRIIIRNMLNNLEEPSHMLNALLMRDGKIALDHFNRFWINSTFGLAGAIDFASAAEITRPSARQFGDVLGFYNVGNGAYVMLPLYGPLTIREGVGDVVDGLYPPLAWLTWPPSLFKWLIDGMESRAAVVPQEPILASSPDPYVFTRNAYLQHKAFMAQGSEQIQTKEEIKFDEALLDEVDDY